MFGISVRPSAARMLAAAAIAATGLSLGVVTATAQSHPAATMPGAPTVTMQVQLASNDTGGPHSDVSGPNDRDSDNIAPPPPDSGTGMECEDSGVTCDHDQSGTALISDNDEV